MADVADKLAYFQAITGLENPDLCIEILAAHGWDLELAISSFTSSSNPTINTAAAAAATDTRRGYDSLQSSQSEPQPPPPPPSLAWKLIKLPISVISGSLGLTRISCAGSMDLLLFSKFTS